MQKRRNTWEKWYWLVIFLPVTIIGFLLFVFYGHRYGNGGIAGLSFLLSLSLPICFQIVYLEYKSKKWYERLVNALLVVICVGPFVVGLIWAKDKYYDYQLETYPKIVYGQVTGFETTHGKGGTKHYATFCYLVDDEKFIQRVGNNDFYFKMDDSLKIIVSSHDPEIFRIIGVKAK